MATIGYANAIDWSRDDVFPNGAACVRRAPAGLSRAWGTESACAQADRASGRRGDAGTRPRTPARPPLLRSPRAAVIRRGVAGLVQAPPLLQRQPYLRAPCHHDPLGTWIRSSRVMHALITRVADAPRAARVPGHSVYHAGRLLIRPVRLALHVLLPALLTHVSHQDDRIWLHVRQGVPLDHAAVSALRYRCSALANRLGADACMFPGQAEQLLQHVQRAEHFGRFPFAAPRARCVAFVCGALGLSHVRPRCRYHVPQRLHSLHIAAAAGANAGASRFCGRARGHDVSRRTC
jgi:hypothetical protein